MRKTKLLMASIAILCAGWSIPVQAFDEPVAPVAPDPSQFIEFLDDYDVNSEERVYLYNEEANLFFASGYDWNTRAALQPFGYEVWFTTEMTVSGEVKYAEDGYFFNDNVQHPDRIMGDKDLFTDGDGNTWCDHNWGNGDQTDYYWTVTQVGDAYRIQNVLFAGKSGNEDKYLGWRGSLDDTRLYMITEGEGFIDFKVVSADSYMNYESEYEAYKEELAIYNLLLSYSEIRESILAIDSNIDLSAADDIAESATTKDEIDEAVNLAKAALTDFLAEKTNVNYDLTSFYVVNPSFETGNYNGWTVEASTDTRAADNSNSTYTIDNADGKYVFNIWSSGNPISQTINDLPNGNYKLVALIATDANQKVQLNANGVSVQVDAAAEGKGHGVDGEVEFTVLEGTATIGAEGVNKYWYKVDNFRLYYLGAIADLTPFKNALANAVKDAEKVEGTIPAAAYNLIKDAITDNNEEWNSQEDYETAIKAINSAVATYASADIQNAYSRYNTIKSAVLAINGDIDTSAADKEVEAATDKETIDAAVGSVRAALSAYLATAQVNGSIDLTDALIDNAAPGVSHSLDYWENSGGPSWEYSLYEYWQQQSQTTQQTIATELPKGFYTLTAIAYTRTTEADGNWDGFLFAGEDQVTLVGVASSTVNVRQEGDAWIAKGNGVNILNFELSAPTSDLPIGIQASSQGDGWTCWRSFKLEYLGTDQFAPYKVRLAAAVEAAEKVGEIPTAARTAFDQVINDNNKEWSTIGEYEAAITAIEEATAQYSPLVAPYAEWLAVKPVYEELAAAENDNERANNAFKNSLKSSNDMIENELDPDFDRWMSSAKEAAISYVKKANPVGDAVFNMTFMLTNPDLTNVPGWTSADGWYCDQTQAHNSQVMNDNQSVANSVDKSKYAMYEYWSNNAEPTEGFVVYQKLDLPVGTYKMTALAFAGFGGGHRYGIQTDGEHQMGPLGDGSPNITFSAGDTDGTPINTPTLEEASIDFVQAVAGEVKIGLKAHAGNRSNWMGIGYIQLYKVHSVEVEFDEDVAFEPESVAGKVTLKRTLNAGQWNTFAVPFQITNEELVATFGEGTEVAEFSEALALDENSEPVENESVISFDKMETPSVIANRPVLLNPASVAATGEYVFMNRTVAAGIAFVRGLNFEFVGNYDGEITLTSGDYFLNNNTLYESDGSNKLKGTRAYIAAKAEGARIAGLFIDGVSEDVTAIEGLQLNNAVAGKLYNLNGQQVKSAKKGLYIRDGKKLVVK